MYTKTKIVFFSPTHSSREVAKAVAQAIDLPIADIIDITYHSPKTQIELQDTLVVIAVPVYAGRVPIVAAQRLAQLKGKNSPCVLVALYGNRDYDDALLELRDITTSLGFMPIAAAAFIGEHSYSTQEYPIAAKRPDTMDLEKAKSFGIEIALALQDNFSLAQIGELKIKGNYPYKPYNPTSATPVTDTTLCIGCKICIQLCPVNAIRVEDEIIISNPETCIRCCACVKQCHSKARTFNTPYSALLYKNCSTRREPEWTILK